MKRLVAGQAALAMVALGAATMLVITAERESRTTAASSPAPPPETTTTAPTTTTTDPQVQKAAATTPSSAPALSAAEARTLAQNAQQAFQRSVPDGEVGLEIYDRQTGTVVTSLDATEQFSSMSVVKLLIAIDVVAGNDFALPSQPVQDQLTQMLSTSDDDIASSLWDAGGGSSIIARDVALMHLTDTEPPATDGEWGDTKTTAADLVTVYRYLMDSFPANARDLLYNAMYHANQTAADGTDQYFGIPDGLPGTTWAIKQGWGSSGSTGYFDTTGLVGAAGDTSRYVVVVLGSGPLSDYGSMPAAVTAATAALAPAVEP